LARLGGRDVEFLGPLPDERIRELYRACGVVLLPGEEDFGIVPVEAQACARPVVAPRVGGVLETVVDSVTGILVEPGSAVALAEGIRRALDQPFDAEAIRANAERFGRQRFIEQMTAIVDETMSARVGLATW
jgi:glycosyltransferase involved in cell wall biosynthesis